MSDLVYMLIIVSLSYCNCSYVLLFLFAYLYTLCSLRFVYNNNDINNDYISALPVTMDHNPIDKETKQPVY